jgi:hypothetical protein
MKIMVFLHGTAIMHNAGLNKTPSERVRQVQVNEATVHDYETYIPVGAAYEKLNNWHNQGAEIQYLSSHTEEENIEKDIRVLSRYHFPEGHVLYRHNNETYAYVAEKALPDILIEDDCESIGGEKEMTFPNIQSDIKRKIKSIVIKEFSGIDTLPDNIEDLKKFT